MEQGVKMLQEKINLFPTHGTTHYTFLHLSFQSKEMYLEPWKAFSEST